MDFKTFMFWAFAAVLVYASLRVISARNPVVAALHLVLAFFNAAGLWLLLRAEFLAITLVLVYVGAVMVLFLFVVMMLDVNTAKVREGFWGHLPLAAVVGIVMVLELAAVLWQQFRVEQSAVPLPAADYSNTKALGRLIYTEYVYAFEIAAVLLLVAIVAAIALTLRHRKDTKQQVIGEQLRVRREDRVRLVSMPGQRERAATGADAAAAPQAGSAGSSAAPDGVPGGAR